MFQPLLGSIDHAAEALLLGTLSGGVPAESAAQKDYFEPDMNAVKKKSVEFLRERARSLKRLLVHRSPLMPTGLLIFCLDYAKKDTEPLPGVFSDVRAGFSSLSQTGIVRLMDEYYEFRNTYIAHEKAALEDIEITRAGLMVWAEVLTTLHGSLH